jgi:glycosyltransferase involved in cell wall biosynthesis
MTTRIEAPRVTVIVPARNERDAIRQCLDSLRRQTETRLQIVVVDGCSEDGTDEVVLQLAEEDPRIELLHNPQRTVPYALNIALAAARAPLLVRVDAHATVPPEYVARAAQLLETGEWGAVGGLKRGVGRTPQGRAVAAAMASRFGVGGSYYHYGDRPREVEHVPFGAYPAQVAREVGGWGEEFTVNQDFEFDHRVRVAGHKILFDPDLVIDWECRQSVKDLFKQYRRYGKGKVKVALRHPSSVSPRHLLPPALVGYLSVVLSGAALRRRPEWLVAAAPYVGALGVASWTLRGSVPDTQARVFVPAAFAAMHLGWGLGFWEGVLHQVRDQPGP